MPDDREEFPLEVKKALAERAGFRCSFPGCEALTIGPSDETPTSRTNIGNAAHIYSASHGKGARRNSAGKKPEFIRSIENGIWACATHATLIDKDEIKYSVEVIKHWRLVAEKKAAIRVRTGKENVSELFRDGVEFAFCIYNLDAHFGCKTNLIEVFDEMCVGDIWGRSLANVIRELVVELALNAWNHGGATKVNLEFSENEIILRDNGLEFDFVQLCESENGRGGAYLARGVRDQYGSQVVIGSFWREKFNEYRFTKAKSLDDFSFTECCIDIYRNQRDSLENHLTSLDLGERCKTIYILLHENSSPSVCVGIKDELFLRKVEETKVNLVFIGDGVSELFEKYLKMQFPGSQVVDLGR